MKRFSLPAEPVYDKTVNAQILFRSQRSAIISFRFLDSALMTSYTRYKKKGDQKYEQRPGKRLAAKKAMRKST